MNSRLFAFVQLVLLSTVLSLPATCMAQKASGGVRIEHSGDIYKVHLGEHPFTELHVGGFARPILYPVLGPGQTPMTRSHPMKKGVEGEAEDHPHHKSIWCAHGLINDVSFWHEQGKIEVDRTQPVDVSVAEDGKSGSISFHSNYNHEGEKICTDHTMMTFYDLGESRAIDWDVTIVASEGDIVFGDTKEGMMATRTHASLRIDKGGQAVNSEGVEGKDIWGKRAKWVNYSAKVEGKDVGVAIFDHPENLRHPTTWHARAYGLVAANPFGLHHFEGADLGKGNHELKKGEAIRFRYRFVFHPGDVAADQINEMYDAFGLAAKK